ncbi:oligopeptide ABC transporter ATP-binding protein [Roseobacter sp. AzwK-3b]|uniref:oligopeptide/dipeptide ABC transporter ATP-binding protein n=1 Tax=Roseobacter sp. AzwK-3b TaxID=351016 RepID=UPI000156936B|nr:oligopeptide/dipeptide ABC transporter ATP-binding protein [Roseobacter sp. AzwK-3b]EDM72111.1 oligopeptide ABC transporter ATP-binding protein [Roseobacter sp. AzwK-3b]
MAEIGPAERLYSAPRHPYTEALLAAMPSLDPDRRTLEAPLAGDPPNPIDPPPGCRFHTRCARAFAPCASQVPASYTLGGGHVAACHLNNPKEHVA